ncbi:MAG: YggS family pyridoxal phosphate-dependent enzyme [Candidatus Dadabacteria bacterium]|nr:YggS family pyridoxal phosphate-dependent enzyme [Candidatus Dadabacteria bacterium]
MDLESNLNSVRKRIENAAAKAGRDSSEIKLVAVTKKVEPERVIKSMNLGINTFGENYAQEFRDKFKVLEKEVDQEIKWHFIGQLQKNKVKYVMGKVELIHSLDSLSVAEEINKRAENMGITVPVLIEVDTGGEESKGGINPSKLEEFLKELRCLSLIDVQGLMTMPPYFDDPETARPYFYRLRELRDSLLASFPKLNELSMGMSGDFEVAIEEGATIIRVGSAIFGERD